MKHKQLVLFLSLGISSGAVAQGTTTPSAIPTAPVSEPGQCHALVNVPAKLASRVETYVAQEASETLDMKPAKYEWIEKQVPVSEEEKTIEIIPAQYKTIEEKVIVEPERKEYEVIPAKYEDVIEKIISKPAMRVWQKSSNGTISLTGEVMRLIEAPAEYETITTKKLIAPPQIREIVIPAEYAVIKKKIIDKPASTREVIIPAEFKTIRVKKLIEEAKEVRTPTAPIMGEITKREVAQAAVMKWQRVPCDNDLNEANIVAIQKGLKAAGYDVTADGKFGSGSKEALENFQESKGLAKGAVTIETLKALGVNIK